MLKNWNRFEYALMIGIIFLQLLRFWKIEKAPFGFYLDEAAGASHVMCILQTGENFHGDFFTLFSASLGGGYTTLVYAWLQTFWTFFAGTSIADFRSFSVVAGIFAVWGIFVLAKYFAGRTAGLLAALMLSLSPWFFLATRLAWDPPLVLPFLLWGMVFFLAFPKTRVFSALSGLCFAFAMLAYPPTKVQLFLLIPLLFFFQYRWNIKAMVQKEFPFLLIFGLFTLSLLSFYWNHPEALDRSEMLSIAGGYYWEVAAKTHQTVWNTTELFISNLAHYFSLDFWWKWGDSTLRHHTGFRGMMSGFEIMGIVAGGILLALSDKYFSEKEKKILPLCFFGYLFGVLPAALTWEGTPHALRAIGALPFSVLFASVSLFFVWQKFSHHKWMLSFLIIPLFFSVSYFVDFFQRYPSRSEIWFENDVVQSAEQGQKTSDFSYFEKLTREKNYDMLAKSYFLMEYKGDKCKEIRNR